MLDRTMPAVLAYAEPRLTRNSGGLKHAAVRFGDRKALCGVTILSYGEPAPQYRPPDMCDECASKIYTGQPGQERSVNT